jgi:hypothetical protein
MEKIKLDSGLNEYAFGKTDFSELLTDEGFIAETEETITSRTVFSFHNWRFDEIKTPDRGDDAHVFFCGSGFSGIPLTKLLDSAAGDGADNRIIYDAARASYAVCLAIGQAAREHIPTGNTGAGGIYVACTEKTVRILFLPAVLYDTVCGCEGTEKYVQQQGVWRSKALSAHEDAAASFTRAVIAYRALTGRLPYEADDETARNADELDRNYLRLEHAVNGIDKALAASIDSALELPSFSQQKKAPQVLPVCELPLEILYTELGLAGADGILSAVQHPDALPAGEFNAKVSAYYKSKKQKVNARRTIRRNTALLTGAVIAAVVIAGIAVAQHRDNGTKPTSQGLTSAQTVEAFYKAIHTQDVELLGCISRGKAANRYSDTVSQIYVINKTRNAYEYTTSMVTPESWLYYQSQEETPEKRSIFGISSFTLDGQSSSLDLDVPVRRMNLKPVTTEGSTTLTNGCRTIHTAVFYVIHTEGENNDIYAEHHTDTVSLTYKNKKWTITDIKSEVAEIPVNSSQFKTDFMAACSMYQKDSVQASARLRQKYSWLPDTAVMEAEINKQNTLRKQIQY